jgi:class 3 adenylate cyclase
MGFIMIIVLTFGGNSMGVANFPIYAATFRSLSVGLVNGLAALIISPVLCALAAYWPTRNLLRGAAIEVLQPEQTQPLTRQHIVGLLSRGSIQTRFVLGTSVLLLIVLASLIQVVVAHARNYFVNQLRDSASAMVGWNATLIELSLPADAQTINIDQLAQAQGQSFDADAMLRFRSLIDDMTQGGLEQFAITDRDNVVVVSFDQREMGDTLAAIADPQRTTVRAETPEGERVPRIVAEAPLHNKSGDFVGSLRMTMRMTEVQDFLDRVRNILWVIGAVIIIIGLIASYLLSLPFTRAARALATHTARITRGDYSPIAQRRGSPISNLSIRTRLTLLMTVLVALLVGGMGLLVIPIERDQLETTTKKGMLTVIQWIGDFMSQGLPEDFSTVTQLDLGQLLQVAQNLDFAKLQDLTDQTRGQGIAYLAVTNLAGQIVLSDKLALQGEPGPTVTQPTVTEGEWRDEKIWIASTPLRRGEAGEQIGTLSVGFSRAQIETFLVEAQNLFWLTGLIAVLVGLLLAQTLGGAVAAPAEELATGARRVAHGDLSVKFGTRATPTGDELSQLAYAFNQMVAGLREREKLRDLFGRYVGPEVREAIESGRVTLTGERKTITVLYCDMRGSTTFAEQHKPEEVMSALNEYFEVIILAVETYGGIVSRFVGDEAVCVFGAPTALPDHAECAVNASLAMRAGLAYLNSKRQSQNLPALKFGMGLNTGLVIAGATGSEERQEYTLIGDAMNVGARIQELTKTFTDHDILLSEFTRAALGEAVADYAFVDLGEVDIRGKSKVVQVWGLM